MVIGVNLVGANKRSDLTNQNVLLKANNNARNKDYTNTSKFISLSAFSCNFLFIFILKITYVAAVEY